jgi:hypothetical protein
LSIAVNPEQRTRLAWRRKTGYGFGMSTQEILLEEIKHQPESVLRQLQSYLDFLKGQAKPEAPMVEVVADTWEKLGPAPELDYGQL